LTLDRISVKDVDTYLTEKEAQGLKQDTINQHLICLRKMLYKAKEYGYIKEIIPISKRQLAVTDAREGKEIPDEQFWMIHEKAEPFMRAMMIVARLSTCRGNELRTLKWDCVVLNGDDSKFVIRPEFDKVKKGKDCVITEQMRPVFDELNKNRNGCEHVFTYNDRPITKSKFTDAFSKAVVDAGFEKGFYKFHDLRHTGITIMAHNGQVGFRTIQSVAGQHDAKTTQKYMHGNWEAKKRAAEVLTLDSNGKKARHI
jgi:integrase